MLVAYLTTLYKDQQEMRAVADKPHDAIVKFTAASRGPPCGSTASCYNSYTNIIL